MPTCQCSSRDGLLWIATTGGVSTYDGTSFTTLVDYGDHPVTLGFTETGNHRDVWDILEDSRGRIWITTMDGVFRYEAGTFVPFPLPVTSAPGRFEFGPRMVYCVFEAPDGSFWFGTDGAGAARYDGSAWTVYTVESHGLCSDRVSAILQDRRGDVWFGTSDGGVTRFDGSTYTTHLRHPTFSEHSGWGRYLDIVEDRHGHVWFGVASSGGGVHRFDGTSFRHFSEEDGLGGGGVPSMREDRAGRLWLGTTAGVYRLEGARFVNVTK